LTASPLSITETQVFTALKAVLTNFSLASSDPKCPVQIVRGQVNRVTEPKVPDFVVMWPTLRHRLAMNIDDYFDNRFTGSISDDCLTVSTVIEGAVTPGLTLYGAGIAAGCLVLHQTSGSPGGAGAYRVSTTCNTVDGTIYCGATAAMQKTEFVVQLDVHGPASGDNATRIATLMRDQFAVDQFQALPYDIAPLYTDDPRQMPFINAEQQFEERWTFDVHLQINPVVMVTQQFADELVATVDEVQALA
jgi:hypothetical protein